MQKCYRLQFKTSETDWVDCINAEYPYDVEGLEKVVKDFRYRKKVFAKDDIDFRVTCVTTEILDIIV